MLAYQMREKKASLDPSKLNGNSFFFDKDMSILVKRDKQVANWRYSSTVAEVGCLRSIAHRLIAIDQCSILANLNHPKSVTR